MVHKVLQLSLKYLFDGKMFSAKILCHKNNGTSNCARVWLV